MPLYLSNEDQERSIRAIDAVNAMEHMLRQFARGDAIRRPRIGDDLNRFLDGLAADRSIDPKALSSTIPSPKSSNALRRPTN